jgi:Cu(I)/Ag(I) efflux system periplasmic protein CusF
MNHIKSIITVSALLLATTSVFAASHAGAPMAKDPVKSGAAPSVASDMADAEVRKVDKETKKITLKHGVIKNLDMPGMTMVFAVKDAAMLDNLKAGDKIKFKAEQAGSAITVTEIQPVIRTD